MNENLMQEKKDRVIKTIKREQVSKPPFMFIADGYYPLYLGLKKTDITTFDQALEVTTKVTEDLQYDTTLMPYWPANLMVAPFLDILGGGAHVVKDCSSQINTESLLIMESEEYPELIKDTAKYMLDELFPRRFKLLGDKSFDEKFNGFLETMQVGQQIPEYYMKLDNAGTPIIGQGAFIVPVDYIFNFFRNFNGIMRDIKKRPDLVRDAGMAILELHKLFIKSQPVVREQALFVPLVLPPFLSPKDFEKVYWPSFKGLVEFMVEQGHNVICYFEKKFGHLFDYLQDLPKQGVIGMFQEDDIRYTKDKLGKTMAIAGGLSTNIMNHGTKQECIDHVKGLIDDLCPGGGYFIAPDTPMMFSVDAKPENLKAIADYIRDSRI